MTDPESGGNSSEKPKRPELELDQVAPADLFKWLHQALLHYRYLLSERNFVEYVDGLVDKLNAYMAQHYGDDMPVCSIETFEEARTKDVRKLNVGQFAVNILHEGTTEEFNRKAVSRSVTGKFARFGRPVDAKMSDRLSVYLEDGGQEIAYEGGIIMPYRTIPVEGSELVFSLPRDEVYSSIIEKLTAAVDGLENKEIINELFLQMERRVSDKSQTGVTRLTYASHTLEEILRRIDITENAHLVDCLVEVMEHHLEFYALQDVDVNKHRILIGRAGYGNGDQGSFKGVKVSYALKRELQTVSPALTFTDKDEGIMVLVDQVRALHRTEPESYL